MSGLAEEFLRMPGPGNGLVLLRLLGAALLCALIGLERESRNHAAGLRTNMMVGLATATFAVLATSLIDTYDDDSIRIDPLRLIEAVTSGVAFLAAGLIVFSRGEVRGLTTGATVWLSAAVGLSIGVGQWILGIVAAVGGVLILIAMRAVEARLGISGQRRLDAGDEPPPDAPAPPPRRRP